MEKIITYLEQQLAEAYKIHNEEKRKEDKTKAYQSLVKIVMLEEMIENIKKEGQRNATLFLIRSNGFYLV